MEVQRRQSRSSSRRVTPAPQAAGPLISIHPHVGRADDLQPLVAGEGQQVAVVGHQDRPARHREIAVVGRGEGVWSWTHIDDAARATVAALTAPSGIYNIVDDGPSPVSLWLPAFARFVGAPEPPRVTEEQTRSAGGDDVVYYGTKLRGASNAKAKSVLAFAPRRLEWL
ncbi:MAG TPA: NAD-dependent epimerase/dehydratase family protein [Gemmataceae bacterium]|jgi:nucleoside-diphosphate-sugar epimerase|nr:NAD-dependent epimerase/dehydratase family protein [Gemmataceae bacterium]